MTVDASAATHGWTTGNGYDDTSELSISDIVVQVAWDITVVHGWLRWHRARDGVRLSDLRSGVGIKTTTNTTRARSQSPIAPHSRTSQNPLFGGDSTVS